MDKRNGPGRAPGGGGAYALRVCRVGRGETLVVRFISRHYGGCITHYAQGHGQYCRGDDFCPKGLHLKPQVWKGYAAAEIWCPLRRLWFPCVFELTESVELDMRNRFGRGQQWRVSRPKRDDSIEPPQTAAYDGQHDESELAADYDIRPIVATMYGINGIVLDVPNPRAARIIVSGREGVQPLNMDGAQEQPGFDREAFERLRNGSQFRNGKGAHK